MTEHHQIIGELAFPYKAPNAYRVLLDLGIQALPAVRAGLRHDNPDVRLHCCRFLDRYLSPDTLSDLIGMLNDGDERGQMLRLAHVSVRPMQGRDVQARGS